MSFEEAKNLIAQYACRCINPGHSFLPFWSSPDVIENCRSLSQFSLSLYRSAHSEAAVERHFKVVSTNLTKKRAALGEDRLENIVSVAVNYPVLNPQYFTGLLTEKEKRRARAQKKGKAPVQIPEGEDA